MKIIGIVGITDWRIGDRMWTNLEEECRKAFSFDVFVVEHTWYLPWQKRKIATFAEDILRKYDTGEEILLLAHSFGGIVACAIAPRFKNSPVRAVVTINSPHAIKYFYTYLRTTPQKLDMPVITFGSIFDLVVPFFLTRYPESHHLALWVEHFYAFVWSRYPARKVAEKIKDVIF